MKNTFYCLMLGLSIIIVSCNEANILSEAEKAQIEKDIKVRLEGYPKAFDRKDIDWFHNFWSNEKDFVIAGDGDLKTNYDSAITQVYLAAFPSTRELLHFKFTDGHAYIINKDAVSYTTKFDWGLVTTTGDTVKSRGSWLYVFHKVDGIWKVVHSAGTHHEYK